MDDRFKHHPPKDATVIDAHQDVRQGADALFGIIGDVCPDSREKSIAIIKLEEATMWANAAIARNQ